MTGGLKLYNFVDNHDVERIYTKLVNKAHFLPVHILLYTLPGIPSVYYGSEFGIDGRKWRGGPDNEIRPALSLSDFTEEYERNRCVDIIRRLGKVRSEFAALTYGSYRELFLTTRQYAFARENGGQKAIVAVNNDDNGFHMSFPAEDGSYTGVLSGREVNVEGGRMEFDLPGNSGDILIPAFDRAEHGEAESVIEPIKVAPQTEERSEEKEKTGEDTKASSENRLDQAVLPTDKPYEEMTVEELQKAIYEKMKKNGPVTDRMYRDITENTHKGSLLNWVKSFR